MPPVFLQYSIKTCSRQEYAHSLESLQRRPEM